MTDDDAEFETQLEARLERVNERAEALRHEWGRFPRAPNPETMTLEVMCQQFAFWPDKGVVIDIANPWRTYTVQNFRHWAAGLARTIVGPRGGERQVPLAQDWLEESARIDVDGFAFDPGKPPITRDVNGRPAVNRWRPPPIGRLPLPADWEQQAAIFDQHLDYLIPDKTERHNVARWLAHRVQRPGELPGWHLLLVAEGVQGTGRNWVARLMKAMLGEYVVEGLRLHKILDGDFNAELATAVLGIVDEIREGGQDYWKHAEALKSFLSEKTRLINQKYEPVYETKNCMGVILLSNHLDALPLDETDRRVYAARCTATPREAGYFDSIYGAIALDEVLRAIYERLRREPLHDFPIGGRAPASETKAEVIEHGQSEEEVELRRLMREWPSDVIRSSRLRDLLQEVRWPEGSQGLIPRDAAITTAQLRKLYRATGARPWKQQVTLGGKLTRVVVLRHFEARWKRAEDREVVGEVERGDDEKF